MFGGWFAGFGGGIPNFNFSLGEETGRVTTAPGVTWVLRDGKASTDDAAVTIFVLALSGPDAGGNAAMRTKLGRNAMQKAKTLRLPGVLRCLDAVEHKETIYIATDRCVPLEAAIRGVGRETYYRGSGDSGVDNAAAFNDGVALGVSAIAKALSSLHQNNLSHNNVSPNSIVALPSGEWRLFGLEAVGLFDEEHSLYHQLRGGLPQVRVPAGRGLQTVHGVDAWGLGCLLYEVFNESKPVESLSHADLRAASSVPRKLMPTLAGLLATDPKMRWTLSKFVTECALLKDSTYVADLDDLAELSLRDAAERDAFYRRLAVNAARYPLPACTHLILPKLNNATQFGASSATVLEPLMRIGARLPPNEFAEYVTPSLVSLFSSTDSVIRQRLLENAEQYAALIPAAVVCEVIWPHFNAGFSHRGPEIRELTVRALIHFAPRLNETILSGDVIKGITALQQDREPSIRTNATIGLRLIRRSLPDADRSKILLSGFGRMLKDPFAPSRAAALQSFGDAADDFSEEVMATKILPLVTPYMVDAEPQPRKAALEATWAMVRRVDTYALALPDAAGSTEAPAVVSSSAGRTAAAEAGSGGRSSSESAADGADAKPSGWWSTWSSGKAPTPPAVSEGRSPTAASQPCASTATVDECSRGGRNLPTLDTPPPAMSASTEELNAPTARTKSRHEDPSPTTSLNNTARSVGWASDAAAPPAASPAPVRTLNTTASKGGMSLRKKGLAGARKAE